jgi:hypothetical protein
LRSFALLEHRLLVLAHARGWGWPRMWDARPVWGWNQILRSHAPGEPYELAWHRTEDLLRVLRDEVTAMGAEFIIVVVPHRMQVQRRVSQRGADAADADVPARDWNLPERRLHAFFVREGIDAILLLEDLRAASAADPSPVYAGDFHLSGRGHLLAAERVAEWSANPGARAGLRAEPRFTTPVAALQAPR